MPTDGYVTEHRGPLGSDLFAKAAAAAPHQPTRTEELLERLVDMVEALRLQLESTPASPTILTGEEVRAIYRNLIGPQTQKENRK